MFDPRICRCNAIFARNFMSAFEPVVSSILLLTLYLLNRCKPWLLDAHHKLRPEVCSLLLLFFLHASPLPFSFLLPASPLLSMHYTPLFSLLEVRSSSTASLTILLVRGEEREVLFISLPLQLLTFSHSLFSLFSSFFTYVDS